MDISKSSLFYNISEDEQISMMHCFNTSLHSYSSGEVICFFDEDDKRIGIIESGSAKVIHSLPNGSQTILENLNEGDIFGQLFYYYAEKENISVEASKNCQVRFIDYEHIIKRCSKACLHHSRLVHNVLCMISEKTQSICEHLEVLSRRSIRERLFSYFEILSNKNNSRTFELPFTISALADYLSVDRSAMSRELKKMRDEDLIKMSKRKVTLNYFDSL